MEIAFCFVSACASWALSQPGRENARGCERWGAPGTEKLKGLADGSRHFSQQAAGGARRLYDAGWLPPGSGLGRSPRVSGVGEPAGKGCAGKERRDLCFERICTPR